MYPPTISKGAIRAACALNQTEADALTNPKNFSPGYVDECRDEIFRIARIIDEKMGTTELIQILKDHGIVQR